MQGEVPRGVGELLPFGQLMYRVLPRSVEKLLFFGQFTCIEVPRGVEKLLPFGQLLHSEIPQSVCVALMLQWLAHSASGLHCLCAIGPRFRFCVRVLCERGIHSLLLMLK